MPQPSTLGVLAGLLLTGTVSGVYLGNSAIDEINPAHFRGPAIHPRDRGAEVDPNQYAERSAFAGAIWYGDKPRLEGPECADCELYRLAFRSAGVQPESYVEEARTVSFSGKGEAARDFDDRVETAFDPADEAHREALVQVARYAHASYEPARTERAEPKQGSVSPVLASAEFSE